MRTYSLDPQAAAQAGVSNYITETGKYKGKFLSAEILLSQQGTEGVELSFESTDGRRANYIQLWTYNRDGKELASLKVLNAIMACLRLRELKPGTVTVETKEGSRQVQGFPELQNKLIGVLLQKEEYTKNDGKDGYRFHIFAPFEPNTELTAGEILNRKTHPEQLAKLVALLKDRPRQEQRTAATASAPTGSATYGNDPHDDDIPFIHCSMSHDMGSRLSRRLAARFVKA